MSRFEKLFSSESLVNCILRKDALEELARDFQSVKEEVAAMSSEDFFNFLKEFDAHVAESFDRQENPLVQSDHAVVASEDLRVASFNALVPAISGELEKLSLDGETEKWIIPELCNNAFFKTDTFKTFQARMLWNACRASFFVARGTTVFLQEANPTLFEYIQKISGEGTCIIQGPDRGFKNESRVPLEEAMRKKGAVIDEGDFVSQTGIVSPQKLSAIDFFSFELSFMSVLRRQLGTNEDLSAINNCTTIAFDEKKRTLYLSLHLPFLNKSFFTPEVLSGNLSRWLSEAVFKLVQVLEIDVRETMIGGDLNTSLKGGNCLPTADDFELGLQCADNILAIRMSDKTVNILPLHVGELPAFYLRGERIPRKIRDSLPLLPGRQTQLDLAGRIWIEYFTREGLENIQAIMKEAILHDTPRSHVLVNCQIQFEPGKKAAAKGAVPLKPKATCFMSVRDFIALKKTGDVYLPWTDAVDISSEDPENPIQAVQAKLVYVLSQNTKSTEPSSLTLQATRVIKKDGQSRDVDHEPLSEQHVWIEALLKKIEVAVAQSPLVNYQEPNVKKRLRVINEELRSWYVHLGLMREKIVPEKIIPNMKMTVFAHNDPNAKNKPSSGEIFITLPNGRAPTKIECRLSNGFLFSWNTKSREDRYKKFYQDLYEIFNITELSDLQPTKKNEERKEIVLSDALLPEPVSEEDCSRYAILQQILAWSASLLTHTIMDYRDNQAESIDKKKIEAAEKWLLNLVVLRMECLDRKMPFQNWLRKKDNALEIAKNLEKVIVSLYINCRPEAQVLLDRRISLFNTQISLVMKAGNIKGVSIPSMGGGAKASSDCPPLESDLWIKACDSFKINPELLKSSEASLEAGGGAAAPESAEDLSAEAALTRSITFLPLNPTEKTVHALLSELESATDPMQLVNQIADAVMMRHIVPLLTQAQPGSEIAIKFSPFGNDIDCHMTKCPYDMRDIIRVSAENGLGIKKTLCRKNFSLVELHDSEGISFDVVFDEGNNELPLMLSGYEVSYCLGDNFRWKKKGVVDQGRLYRRSTSVNSTVSSKSMRHLLKACIYNAVNQWRADDTGSFSYDVSTFSAGVLTEAFKLWNDLEKDPHSSGYDLPFVIHRQLQFILISNAFHRVKKLAAVYQGLLEGFMQKPDEFRTLTDKLTDSLSTLRLKNKVEKSIHPRATGSLVGVSLLASGNTEEFPSKAVGVVYPSS
jgi:hypothetical protein